MTRRRGGRRLCDEAGEERDIWDADEGARYKVMTARVKQSRCVLAFSGRPPDAKWRQFLLFAVLPPFFSCPPPLGFLSDHLHHRDPQTFFSSRFFSASLYSRTSSLARKPLHPASGPVHFSLTWPVIIRWGADHDTLARQWWQLQCRLFRWHRPAVFALSGSVS